MSERWKPEKGETFWWFDFNGRVFQRTYHDNGFDSNFVDFGNMFKTEEKAKAAVEKIKALLLSLQEPFTDCKQLPKLTAEVFDRPDCPAWAKYAVVDSNGYAWLYKDVPTRSVGGGWFCEDTYWKGTHGIWDAFDWQNSLIEKALPEVGKKSYKELSNARPLGTYARDEKMNYINGLKNKKSELAVFPEWCKVGEWVYSPCCCDPNKGTYFKVTQIDGVCIIGEDYVCHVDNAVRARLRPYNTEEMKALVGKVICWCSRDKLYVVESYGEVYGQGCVYFEGLEHFAKDLLVGKYILSDGKPCGVLEHINENGEWVE